jgi:hypothetical protein
MAAEPDEPMRCPTCGAEQVWADACRRCRCDLRMLRAAEQAYQLHRRRCLVGLRNGRIEFARRQAQIANGLRPTSESCRLMALCDLLSERWLDAVQLARRATALPPDRGD